MNLEVQILNFSERKVIKIPHARCGFSLLPGGSERIFIHHASLKIKIDEQARHFSFYGGSERIRTSETFLPTRFRVVRLQPLGHASVFYYSISS